MNRMGEIFLVLGLVMVMLGVILLSVGRVPGLGRLPGDICVQRGNWSFYFPLATCVIVSVVLTLLFACSDGVEGIPHGGCHCSVRR